jgi:hypothetical protein
VIYTKCLLTEYGEENNQTYYKTFRFAKPQHIAGTEKVPGNNREEPDYCVIMISTGDETSKKLHDDFTNPNWASASQ